jgi:hypothetical protein
MSQNTSNAVMQRRREPKDSLDDFPTPPWATRAVMEHILEPEFGLMRPMTCWEPACNRGYMARPLAEYFGRVHTSDIEDYGWEGMDRETDFLFPGSETVLGDVDWIITNPPFRLAEQFIHRALTIAREGVAIIQRNAFAEGDDRYKTIFQPRRPAIIAQHVERVPMQKGTCYDTSETATAYSWFIWTREPSPFTRFEWIPKCRRQFERPGDYMEKPAAPSEAPLFNEGV